MRCFGTAFSQQRFPTGNGADGGTNASSGIHGFSIGVNLSNGTDLSVCTAPPPALGVLQPDGSEGWAALGQSCGTRAAADVKEEEKMAHGDKLPGNFYGASYSALSRQLQLWALISLYCCTSLASLLQSPAQLGANTVLIALTCPKALIPSTLTNSHHWLHWF